MFTPAFPMAIDFREKCMFSCVRSMVMMYLSMHVKERVNELSTPQKKKKTSSREDDMSMNEGLNAVNAWIK